MKVRRKPVEMEAMQLLDSNARLVAIWCDGLLVRRADNFEPSIQIMSLEGVKTARLRDYIVKGVDYYYVYSEEVFHSKYEVCDE